MSDGRVRVTFDLGPADTNDVLLFRWLLSVLIAVHAESPVPVRTRVELLRDDPPG